MISWRMPAVTAVIAGTGAIIAGLALLLPAPRGAADAGVVPVVTPTVPPTAAADAPAAVADAPAAIAPEPPVRLVIPSIQVDAAVVDAALARSGTLAVPDDPRQVGWWTGGAQPGGPTGTVVLVGHVDDRARVGALFRLRTLPVGALVSVDGDAHRYTYRVAARRSYPKQHLPAAVFDRTTAPRLVLITCGGAFRAGHYNQNLVVYAEPVTQPGGPAPMR